METVAGKTELTDLRVGFDRRLKLEFHGSRVTSDAGLLAFRELDDALALTEMAGQVLADGRAGKNNRHALPAQFRQSVFGRLSGYEDANAADRLGHDPAMRWVVGGRAVTKEAASTSQMGRFETEVLTGKANLAALADLPGRWIHARRLANVMVLDMDSSVSPTHGEQEGAAYNGHSGCTCYPAIRLQTSSATWSGPACAPATSTALTVGVRCWSWSCAIATGPSGTSSGAMPL